MKKKCCSSNKDNSALLGVCAGILAGAVIGGVAALLASPKSGKDNREFVKKKYNKFSHDVEDQYKHLRDSVSDKAKKSADSVKGFVNKFGKKAQDEIENLND